MLMFNKHLRNQQGFTVPELLLLVLIIIVLSSVVLINIQGASAKRRDSQRVNDINTISGKLETYFNEKDAYPATFTDQDLFGIDEDVLKDPEGRLIVIHTPVADATTAQAIPNPTSESPSDYLYVSYPEGCTNEANNCTGYILRSFIEKPTNTTPNPYIKVGLNNN